MLSAYPRRHLPRAAGRVLLLPRRQRGARAGPLGKNGTVVQSSAELATLMLWRRSRSPSYPARRSAPPGHLRLSYALGDADLEKGVSRLVTLLGGPIRGRLGEVSRS